MTDKLRAAAQDFIRAWDSLTIGALEKAEDHVYELRQELDQLPDTTKMIDTGTDRGAWADVSDATKWVDELRGDDDEPPKREWIGLTDDEIDYIWGVTKPDYEDRFDFPRAIEAKLKEKNT